MQPHLREGQTAEAILLQIDFTNDVFHDQAPSFLWIYSHVAVQHRYLVPVHAIHYFLRPSYEGWNRSRALVPGYLNIVLIAYCAKSGPCKDEESAGVLSTNKFAWLVASSEAFHHMLSK